MARFYTNENVAIPVVAELRHLGHDVLTSFEAGNANSAMPDCDVLEFAIAENRILVSHNRKHFLRLHRSRTKNHFGMVLCTFDADFIQQAVRISAAVATALNMRNEVLRVNRPN